MPSEPYVLPGTLKKEVCSPRSRYQVSQQQIGKGTYSTIYLGKDLHTGQQMAVKVMDLRRYDREFNSEIRLLNLLEDVPGIIQLRHSSVNRDTGCIYMDYIPHPNLYNFVRRNKRLSQEKALTIFWNVLSTLEAIHAQGIAHCDLKPDNIMVDPATYDTIVLDFGLSMVIPASGLSDNFCGSPMYMSPEVLNREKHDPRAADIWSLGVVLYHMLVGDSPWSAVESLDELMDLVIFETSVELPSFLSEQVKELLGAILVHQPSRPSLREIQQRVAAMLY
eukprot:TRINITY_DN10739_c0_g1_i1.p1 TRINITY_DN10739_c0_g1~~TRINITY_DN10739_c0_g1_i1.p1  ORF type:complete len:278 (-),score=36.50 TRINITY_DN10739_c0_g1_i1:145-978(-)